MAQARLVCVHIVKVRVRVGDLSPCPRGPGLEKEERKGQGGAADARPGMGAQVVTSDPLEVPSHRGAVGALASACLRGTWPISGCSGSSISRYLP